MNRPTKKIFIIAGEPSGDQLGAGLMAALKKRSRDPLVFAGVGGPAMVEQGLQTLYPMRDLTVIGITEILPHVPRLMDRARQTIKAMEAFQPDVVITIDSPGFNNRVIEKGKKRGILKTKFVHYVAPTVWAYKPHRAAEIAKIYDHLMVILPFEQPYFAKEGLPTNFVGHPIVDDLDVCFKQRPNANIRAVNRLRLCLLAGSRAGK